MNNIVAKLLKGGVLSEESAKAVDSLNESGASLDEALLLHSGLTEEKLLRTLARELDVPYMDAVEEHLAGRDFLAAFPAHLLLHRGLLPLKDECGAIVTATSRAFDTSGLDELRLATGRELRPVLAPAEEIERCLRKALGVGADTVQSLISNREDMALTVLSDEPDEGMDITAGAEDASIIRFVNQVLKEAIDLRATDVHFEPFENELRVRYRVDGILQEAAVPSDIRRFQAAIV